METTPNRSDALENKAAEAVKTKPTHPLWLRLSHWGFALAILILIPSGWQIYNASPVFHFLRFSPRITLGGWLAGGIKWHFAAMWLLWISGIVYVAMNLLTGRFAKKYWPLGWRAFWSQLWLAATFRLEHGDLRQYNMVQKVAYLVAISAMIVTVCSGLVVWKSVQFSFLGSVMGGYDNARIIHFLGMAVLCGFIAIHIALVILVPRTLLGMIVGKFRL